MNIKLADDFSKYPSGRTKADGQYSGEEFRENFLFPMYSQIGESNEKIVIDFDGCYGCPPSFLEESFGGMVRHHNAVDILKKIEIVANDDLNIAERIQRFVKEAIEALYK